MTAKKGAGTSDKGTGEKGEEVKFEITELPRGGSLKAPEYGRLFSEQASRRFFQKYRSYEEALLRSNKGRTVKSVLLTMQELVPKHIQNCIADTIFDGGALDEEELRDGIARHAK